ncbi:hypothetical protein MMC28_011117, partial [Mycoblastus sanguinarius]|nr:hypothetical protein [Mycoblastus sanguinarius]
SQRPGVSSTLPGSWQCIPSRNYANGKKSVKKNNKSDLPPGRLKYKVYPPPKGHQPNESRTTFGGASQYLQHDPKAVGFVRRLIELRGNFHCTYHAARHMILGFSAVFIVVFVCMAYDINRAKHRGRDVYDPRVPVGAALPSSLWEIEGWTKFFAYAPSDWVHSPLFPVTMITNNFAHGNFLHLCSQTIVLSITLALLKKTLTTSKIVVSFIGGGTLAANIHCMITYFTNPYMRLSDAELDTKLLYLQRSLHRPEERRYNLETSDQDDWRNSLKTRGEIGAALRELEAQFSSVLASDLESWRSKVHDLNTRLENVEERIRQQEKLLEAKSLATRCKTPAWGSSSSTACLGLSSLLNVVTPSQRQSSDELDHRCFD